MATLYIYVYDGSFKKLLFDLKLYYLTFIIPVLLQKVDIQEVTLLRTNCILTDYLQTVCLILLNLTYAATAIKSAIVQFIYVLLLRQSP